MAMLAAIPAVIAAMSASELAAAGIAAASLIGTGISTASQAQSAKATAKGQEAEAESIQVQRDIAMRDERQRNKETLSKQAALAAASGVGTTTGTPLETALTSAYQGEMNALRIGYTGDTAAESRRYGARVARATIPGTIAGGAFSAIGKGLSAYSYGGGFGRPAPTPPSNTSGGGSLSGDTYSRSSSPLTSADTSINSGGSLLSNWANRNTYGPYDYRRYRL